MYNETSKTLLLMSSRNGDSHLLRSYSHLDLKSEFALNTQRNRTRTIWIIAGVIMFMLFIIAYIIPNPNTASRRGDVTDNSTEVVNQWVIAVVPAALILGGLWWLTRRSRTNIMKDALSLGKNRYHTLTPQESTLTFKNVGGAEKAKAELREIARFLKEPQAFAALGIRPPSVLLTGAPGTGKTLLAKALCKETGLPLFHTSGSEFVEMFVGIGASRIRDLFEAAKRQAPSIVFVDALDAIGRRRETNLAANQSEYENALHQLLAEMDNLKTDTRIIVIAATNRPDLLDPALTRSGRFDRQINLAAPNPEDREAILKIHAQGKPVDASVNWQTLANSTEGFVGADLERLVSEAALTAGKNGRNTIGMSEFESAARLVRPN
jgi:cell division protease FtsH